MKYIDSVNETLPFSHKIKSLFLSYDDIQNRNAIKVSRTYLRKGIEDNKIHLLSFDKGLVSITLTVSPIPHSLFSS